jgi:predicted nucleotidyltransferase
MARSSLQSALRFPLTAVLGTEANVRVLRELARHGGELSAPSLVARSRLAQSSVREALMALETVRVVEPIGSGRARLFRLNSSHPLTSALSALFEAEEERFNAVLEAIGAAAETCGPGIIIAVWIYGSVARGEDNASSDLDIALVSTPDLLQQAENAMQDALHEAAERLAFTPSLLALDTNDVLRLSRENDPWWKGAIERCIPIRGGMPEVLVQRMRRMSDDKRISAA